MRSLETLAKATHTAQITQQLVFAIGPYKQSRELDISDQIGPGAVALGTMTPKGGKAIQFEVYKGQIYFKLPTGRYADAVTFTAAGLGEVMVDGQALNFANHIRSVSVIGPATFDHQAVTAYQVELDPAYVSHLASNLSGPTSFSASGTGSGSQTTKSTSASGRKAHAQAGTTTTTTPLVKMTGVSLIYYLAPGSGQLVGMSYKAQAVASGQALTAAVGGQLPPNLKGDNIIFNEIQTAQFGSYGIAAKFPPPNSVGLLTAGEENELFPASG